MREELFEEILSLVEEFINELDDETVNNSAEKRRENEEKAIDKYLEAVRKNNGNYDAEEVQQAREDGRVSREKYQKNQDLRAKRNKRLEKKLSDFKEKLINRKPQTAKETQQASSEHSNAMIDQHYRNKLEKVFSNECFESLISLIEGELIDFQQKRKEKVLDRNAHKMAQMMQDGSLNAVRVLPNKELIGDPAAIKKVKDIQAENEEVIRKCKKHG